jgi:hypothetical protein
VSSLFGAELRSGVLLLEILELLQPGCVDWRLANRPPFVSRTAQLKALENCQLALKVAQVRHLGSLRWQGLLRLAAALGNIVGVVSYQRRHASSHLGHVSMFTGHAILLDFAVCLVAVLWLLRG